MVSSAALSGAMFNIAPPHLRGAATRRPRGSSVFTHAFSTPRRSNLLLLVRQQRREKRRVGRQWRRRKRRRVKRVSVYTNQILAPFVRSYSAYGDPKRCPRLQCVVNKFQGTRSWVPPPPPRPRKHIYVYAEKCYSALSHAAKIHVLLSPPTC